MGVNKQVNFLIDARPVSASSGHTILQTCSVAGIDVPRFCYHDKLLIAGNCRICLVEVTGSKKLVASCAVHISENMSIYTNTIRVRIARQNVLEFLLANHPLDCPICDQGGECDLQDIAALFGADRGRFYESEKRAVLNKDFGPLIRTSMNRCIHCTRCVRFVSLSSGFSLIGTVGRGSATEISLYINKFIFDELSGNITDLCPVGALTSKPYAFRARPWELVSVLSVDVFDSMNSSLVFDVMANKVYRVLPYSNDTLNECWLTNKGRYAYDGLFVQRLNSCLLKTSFLFFSKRSIFLEKVYSQVFIKLPWSAAFQFFFKTLVLKKLKSVVTFLGSAVDLVTTLSAKIFLNVLGGDSFFFENLCYGCSTSSLDFCYLYLFNTSLADLAKMPSFCLIMGLNLRFEAPLVNLKLTRLAFDNSVAIYKIGGSAVYSSYRLKMIANSLSAFYEICEFRHAFCKNFYISKFIYRPFIFVSGALLSKYVDFNFALTSFVRRIQRSRRFYVNFVPEEVYNFFGFIHQYSGQIHAFDVGLTQGILKVRSFEILTNSIIRSRTNCAQVKVFLSFFYLIGFDSYFSLLLKNKNFFLVYQGSHGIGLASAANLVLPVVTYIEKAGFFKNLLGCIQKTNIVLNYDFGPKSDIEVFKGLLLSASFKFFNFFFSFNFYNGVLFNFQLLLSADLIVDSKHIKFTYFLAGYNYFKNFSCCSLITNFFYYFISYDYLCCGALRYREFIGFLRNQSISFSTIFINFFSSLVINYYGDNSSICIASSKTMTLCSNLYLKKNVSFSLTCY